MLVSSFSFRARVLQKLRNLNFTSKKRSLYRINIDFDWNKHGLGAYIFRQFIVFLCVIFGILMAIPYVPGPGTLTILLALLIGNYPGKRRFIQWIRTKKYFRIGRYVLRKRYRILLVMPRRTD